MTTSALTRTPDVVVLEIPVRADLVVLARLTAATMASRADFGVEEIEDLRLAVEELCLSVVRRDDTAGRLRLTYTRTVDAVEIRCTLDLADNGAPDRGAADRVADDLSLRILDALVDDHGQQLLEGRPSAWLRKRRVRATV